MYLTAKYMYLKALFSYLNISQHVIWMNYILPAAGKKVSWSRHQNAKCAIVCSMQYLKMYYRINHQYHSSFLRFNFAESFYVASLKIASCSQIIQCQSFYLICTHPHTCIKSKPCLFLDHQWSSFIGGGKMLLCLAIFQKRSVLPHFGWPIIRKYGKHRNLLGKSSSKNRSSSLDASPFSTLRADDEYVVKTFSSYGSGSSSGSYQHGFLNRLSKGGNFWKYRKKSFELVGNVIGKQSK